MKAGRVIGADELDARARAEQIIADARAQAADIVAAAERERARAAAASVSAVEQVAGEGHVDAVVGLVIHATIAGVALGEVVSIDRGAAAAPLRAEVVGFRGEHAIALPLGELAGIRPAAAVWRTGRALELRCGDDLLGRVVDGIGAPIDGGPPLAGEPRSIAAAAPDALSRPPITQPLPTGIRAIDSLLTLGRGQRV